ncbi:DoxX family protein [Aurantimonas sp. VKM B-3413]|uniref:DoxX family protein n=1 Tax=Aurantimonas sp. VKM B-3413 TaxID=2779401 RepID=UPI001E52D846|nr:DoxX family protein [Aurantimonas sp. VKM B-3413]MCB8836200.1 DoxX family protein [Aurantimonas sp. VKM B-3413]
MRGLLRQADRTLSSIPASLPLLVLRIALAVPFFRSGLTKWDGFLELSMGARFLFEEEFKLHLIGFELAYPMPILLAHVAGTAEILLPILLVLGLGTRLAAFGILAMTAVIQLTVPDGWANFHLPWAAMALALVVFGGGRIAFDRLLFRGEAEGGHRLRPSE